jgi:predicted component of type VI protein secretion system
MERVMRGQEDQLISLQPRDVVYVPPTTITKVNNWMEQYVNRMIPRPPVGVGVTP